MVSGSAAELAIELGSPVVLVVDASKQSHSIAALVAGFRDHEPRIQMAGVILNKVGSSRHETMLREALAAIEMPVLGSVPRDENLVLPSRHLGLVQAQEHRGIEVFIDHAAGVMSRSINIGKMAALSCADVASSANISSLTPPGQKIAVAQDTAFAFAYPHLLMSWRKQGAEIIPFSPLYNEAPDQRSDAIYLPGGYPELYAGQLAANGNFLNGLTDASQRDCFIYGECGGFMVLGDALIDLNGTRHTMANLLPLVTSFEQRKLHLGYRLAKPLSSFPFAPAGNILTAHEFHYSSVIEEGKADRLFAISDARGEDLGECGLRRGGVMGSYLHLIDRKVEA